MIFVIAGNFDEIRTEAGWLCLFCNQK